MDGILRAILTQYFSISRCLIIITDENNILNIQSNIPQVSFNLGDTNFSQISHLFFNSFGCQDFILKVNNPVSVFQDVELEIKLQNERFNKRKYVLVSGVEEKQNVFDIFDTEEIQFVSDLLVVHREKQFTKNQSKLFDDSDYYYSLWTHKYVGYSENNKPYWLDMWFETNSSFLRNTNLFPDKMTDQEERIFKAAVFSYEPYVIVELQEDQSYKYMGSEMSALLMFCRHHNMTLVPIINEYDYWGEIWDNWTGNGLMGNLVQDKADIGAAALYTWETSYNFFDLSKPTVRTGVTCLVPAPKLAAGWLTPLYAYPAPTWLAVIALFIVCVLSIYFYEIIHLILDLHKLSSFRNQNNRSIKLRLFGTSLMSVIKLFVTQSITTHEMIKGQLGRYLMGLVFTTVLILSATYQSGLATVMTIPRYENPINTVDEFVASSLSWGATQDAWTNSLEGAEEEKFKKIVSRFVATSEEKLRELSFKGEFAFSLERLPQDIYAVGSYIKEDTIQNFHLMSEDFYWEQCVFMLKKNSVLLPLVDDFVSRVFEAGLISVWQKEAAAQYMNQYVQKAIKYLYHHQNEHKIVKLKVSHLAGAFGVLCVGNMLAIIIFLMELAGHSLYRNEKIKYYNQVSDGGF